MIDAPTPPAPPPPPPTPPGPAPPMSIDPAYLRPDWTATGARLGAGLHLASMATILVFIGLWVWQDHRKSAALLARIEADAATNVRAHAASLVDRDAQRAQLAVALADIRRSRESIDAGIVKAQRDRDAILTILGRPAARPGQPGP